MRSSSIICDGAERADLDRFSGSVGVREGDSAELPESNLWYEPQVQSVLRRRLQNAALPLVYGTAKRHKRCHREASRAPRNRNEAIFHFLNRDSMVNHSKTRPLKQVEDPGFLSLQTQARDIYVCLKECWTCTRPEKHPCGITVSREHINGNALELSFVFNGEDTSILKVQSDEVQLPAIKISEPEDEDIANLRSKLTIRRQKARIISEKGTKGILSSIGLLALDSEARRSSSSQDRTLESHTSLLERGKSFLRSSRHKSIDANIQEPTPATPEKRRISA